MEGQYLCNGEKYKYSKGYIGLPVTINFLPKTITISGKTLFLKSSFHVSLLCVKNIPNLEKELLTVFCDFVSENEISFIDYKKEFRYAKDGDRESVVVMVDVSNISRLYEFLNKKFNLKLDIPPTHITLYTLQPDMGIGLNNLSDIKDKTKVITKDIPVEIKNILS